MKTWLKWPLFIVVGLVVLVVGAVLVLPHLVPLDQFKPYLQNQVAQATGRSLEIKGDLKLTLFPTARLTFSDLVLGSSPGFEKTPFVEIKSFDARVKVMSLLRKQLEVTRFVVHEPRITLLRNAQGQANWDTPATSKVSPKEGAADKKAQTETSPDAVHPEKSQAAPLDLKISDLRIVDGRVLIQDDQTGTKREITELNLELQDVSLVRPVALALSAKVDGQPFALKGVVGPVAGDDTPHKIAFDLDLAALEQIRLKTKGHVVQQKGAPGFDLDLDLAPFSLRKVLAAINVPFPVQIADETVLAKLGLKARVQGTPQALTLTDGKLILDETRLDFSLAAKTFERPDVTFDIRLDQIDIDRYLPRSEKTVRVAGTDAKAPPSASASKPDPQKPSKAIKAGSVPVKTSAQPDSEPLRRLKLDGRIAANQVKASGLNLSDIKVALKADQGLIQIKKAHVGLYKGTLDLDAVVNVKGRQPKTKIKLKVDKVDVGALLAALGKSERIEGRAVADLDLNTAGVTPDEIKKRLNGKGRLQLMDGALIGIDLAAMARNIETAFAANPDGAPAKTPFGELKVPFTVKNGLITTREAGLTAEGLTLRAEGTADLVASQLNLRLTPRVLVQSETDVDQKLGISVPILMTGAFEKPTFLPDVKSLVEQGLKGELETEGLKQVIGKKNYKPIEKQAKSFLKKLF